MERRRRGFTLMEMLIVVAIIGILVAVAIPVFTGSLDRAREAACAANRRSLKGLLAITYMTDGEDAVAGMFGDHSEEYPCPSGEKFTYSIDAGVIEITCPVHSSPDMTMMETYTEYFSKISDSKFKEEVVKAVGNGGTNDMLRKYYYQQNGGWPYFQVDATTYYVQPYIDAYDADASHDIYLLANGNSGTGSNWYAKYYYNQGAWYEAKKGAFSCGNLGWSEIVDRLRPMSPSPKITK